MTQVISSFMQIATVKKILNETTEELLKVRQEMSAMMLMDPLMIMINAVAALLPYLISWNQETIKISEATRKLVDESQEFAETTRDTAATYERTTAGIAAQTKVANEYVDQMEDIKNSSISAGDKQKQLAIIAGKLTALYPELAGKVENYVNNTNASAEALRGAISSSEAYYASQAQAERLK